ncbi:unnamed protein product [Dovyalis caffra]|uniref:Uncharacterized protein n=1 Tax=Dovyalis caffra TaxID=77055 RepID=A0AAV1S7D7_9ROSI|nr:unnamed protein product [Dovyalis caffra]
MARYRNTYNTKRTLRRSPKMVLVSAARDYVNRMLQDISGMKVLILDSQTVSIVSVVYSQSELLQKEVFLVELVDSISKSKESMSHLKAVYFLRPISENIQNLRRQLANPRFGESHLCKFLLKCLEFR